MKRTRQIAGMLSFFASLAACHATPRVTWRPPVCENPPAIAPPPRSHDFSSSVLPPEWTIETGALPRELVSCALPSSSSLELLEGPLAAPWEENPAAKGMLGQVGGDYWSVPYEVGGGACRLDTNLARGQSASLLSPKLGPAKYVSALVGGGGSARGTHVELCVPEDGQCLTVSGTEYSGPGVLGMERKTWDLRAVGAEEREVRLRVVIEARAERRGERILLDELRAGDSPPRPHAARLWGFVDLHAHLFNDSGSGGRTIHGSVFSTDKRDKTRRDKIARALGTTCAGDHGQAGMGFSVEGIGHKTGGFPKFEGWPQFDSIAHQQAYVDWIERAYRGGLRLVQMDVGNNRTYAAAIEQLNPGIIAPIPEKDRREGDGVYSRAADEDTVMLSELATMRRFVGPEGPAHAWAGVAESASEARALARAGKLVLVPGLEADNPGVADDMALAAANHLPRSEARPVVRAYVKKLWDAGIRHVFPVHVMPNVFGDPAVYDRTIYCAGLPEEGGLERMRDGMPFDIRYQVDKDPGKGGFIDFLMTSVLDPLPLDHASKDRNLGYSFNAADCFKWNFIPGRYAKRDATELHLPSTMARKGLHLVGELFVEEAMRRGMLIDVTHASQRARDEILKLAEKYRYPVMASHSNFRELAFGNRPVREDTCVYHPPPEPFDAGKLDEMARLYGTSVIDKVGYEYSLTRSEIDRVRATGGMLGLPFGTVGIGVQFAKDVALDCDGTSKSFAQQYLYARALLQGRGLGFGTDVNGFYMLPAPRFGPRACQPAKDDLLRACPSDPEGAACGSAKQDDATRVAYFDDPHGAGRARHPKLHPSRAGDRTFFVNEDGVAHYGLLPDFLQDMIDVGVTQEELASLFGGLEDYLEMWEAVEARARELEGASFD